MTEYLNNELSKAFKGGARAVDEHVCTDKAQQKPRMTPQERGSKGGKAKTLAKTLAVRRTALRNLKVD